MCWSGLATTKTLSLVCKNIAIARRTCPITRPRTIISYSCVRIVMITIVVASTALVATSTKIVVQHISGLGCATFVARCAIRVTKCSALCTKPISWSNLFLEGVVIVTVLTSPSRSECLTSKTTGRSSKTVCLTIWAPVLALFFFYSGDVSEFLRI